MAVLDEDSGAGVRFAEGDGPVWSSPEAASAPAPRDWRSAYERERARADAAEARCEELRRTELRARTDAGSWKSRFKSCRRKLDGAVEETRELRREIKAGAPGLHREMARLRKELSRALAEPSAAATRARQNRIGVLEAENLELRKALQGAEGHKKTVRWQNDEIVRLVAELRRLRDQKETVRSLSAELYRVREALKTAERAKEKLTARLARFRSLGSTSSRLPFDEAAHLRNVLRRSRRQKTAIKSLSNENARLRKRGKTSRSRIERLEDQLARLRTLRKTLSKSLSDIDAELRKALRRSRRQKATIKSLSRVNARLCKHGKTWRSRIERLEDQLARLRSVRKTLSKKLFGMDAELRKALRRSRRQKAAIKSLSRVNARLRKHGRTWRSRIGMLEEQLAKLRATGAVLSKALFGRKSEKQETPGSGRKRGQQRGAAGHGRTQRPGLEERTETLTPPEDARVCSCCGEVYVANGVDESTLIEIEVKAHKRVIHRPRWRRACGCASSPKEVSAPPPPRLFLRTLYGTTFWTRFLFERFACHRPLHRVAAWMAGHGLPVSPGTLANSLKRFVPLFEPLADAILAHQNTAALRHADETSWRVQELRGEGRSSRAWLWTSVSSDAVSFHIDPSRSAEAALELFGEAPPGTIIVCDRYSAYRRLVRLCGGQMTLAYCWTHQRRDFIECAAGQVKLTPWCQAWIERIAEIYRLNEARLKHYDPGRKRQTPAFRAAQGRLKEKLDSLFAEAERQLAGLDDGARENKALRSLLNHREGLCVFLDRPQTPLDNNLAERMLRGPAIGRRLSFGSDSETGARLTALMYSVIGTLALNGIDILCWLQAWLDACAKNGGKPPDDLSPWLPWSMSEEDRQGFTAAG